MKHEEVTKAQLTRRIALYERPEIVDELERVAAAAGHSMSAQIRQAIRESLRGDEQGRSKSAHVQGLRVLRGDGGDPA